MMKKRLLAFISIILLLVSFFPSSVFAVEARSSISAHDFTTSLEPLESISLEKYNTLLMAWSTIPHIPSDRYANFPSFFGGAYIDENKELVIQVTDNNSDIMEYFAELIDLENVRFQTAENSLAELLEIKYELNKRISSNTSDPLRLSAQDSLIDGTGISIPNNSVNLYVKPDSVSTIAADASAATIESLITGLSNIQIVSLESHLDNSSTDKINNPDNISQTSAQNLMEPGQIIYMQGSRYYPYGIGFWATDSYGNLGIVTCGHGYKDGFFSPMKNALTGTRSLFGTIKPPCLFEDDVDACFVKRDVSGIAPQRYVSGWDFSLSSDSIAVLPQGSTVYMCAPASGCRSGTVSDTYFSPYDASNGQSNRILLEEAVLTTCYAESGDSGGLVASHGNTSRGYVVGIVSGGIIPRNGNNQMYYAKVSPILYKLDLNVW